ncbi:30S ribosomal protein S13, partial [Candidatus Woesebacteria bacterium GWB1_43_5]
VMYALTRIKGLGWSLAKKVLIDIKIDESKRVKDLTKDELAKVSSRIEDYSIEGELIRSVRGNVQRLVQIGSYRGLRHQRNLPLRGQRTRTNARTKRGKRKTVGAFKKEMLSKQTQTKSQEEEKK